MRHNSSRVSKLGGNVFAEISGLAAQHDAINLGQGFPSFGTPDFVKDAAIKAIQEENNQYTRPGGHPAFVQTLAEMYSPLFNRELDPMTNLVTFNGAQEGIYSTLNALLEAGDEVITIEPYFDAYRTCATVLGLKTVGIPLEISDAKRAAFKSIDTSATFSSGDFKLDFAKLEAAITDKTRMIVLNTPHNPTGKVFQKDELEAIVQVLSRHPHVKVLSDEVYEYMVFDGAKHERIGTYDGMFDRTISLFSAGKTFSCTGWRVGYAVGPEHLIAPIIKAHSVVPFCGTTPFEVALSKCFRTAQENNYLNELPSLLQNKRDRMVDALRKANWRPIVPEGGYFVCCDVSHTSAFQQLADKVSITKDTEKQDYPDYQLAYKLCKEHGLAVIPTSPSFSKAENQLSPGVLRVAYCKDDDTLDRAIDTIAKLKL